MSLDVLCLRRPKINYVSPPVCEAIFSGSGIPIIVLEPFNVLTKITGIVVIRDGNTRIISWPAYPGAICYNVYQQQPDGSYILIAECIEDPTITLPPGLPIIIAPVTPDGEGDFSDPVPINGHEGGGGGDCESFIDDVGTDNVATLPNLISRINGMVVGSKNVPGPAQRPWRYFNRVSSDVRTARVSGAVMASQSASDLVDTDGASFFEAGDVGKFLQFTSGGDAREIIAFNSPTQVQVAIVDTVALSTFTVYGQTIGGTHGGADLVNGAGHIVGNENDPASNSRAFWFNSNNGELRDLGDIATFIPVAINENGFALYINGVDGAIYNSDTQASTVLTSGLTPFDFNKNLLVVGHFFIDHFPAASENQAAKWQGGVMTIINPVDAGTGPGTQSQAWLVNEAGLIIGRYTDAVTGRQRTFYNNGGASTSIGFLNPGINPATGWVIHEDLNEAGMLVGSADFNAVGPTGTARGFKWTLATGIVQLDVLPGEPDSYAIGVNEAGIIVGISGTKACIWLPGQLVPEDLHNYLPPASGWTLLGARAITNNNEVVGNGIFNGEFKNYFLKLCL